MQRGFNNNDYNNRIHGNTISAVRSEAYGLDNINIQNSQKNIFFNIENNEKENKLTFESIKNGVLSNDFEG